MALLDKMPELNKNSFTIGEAADLFTKLAEQAKASDTPKQIVDTLIKLAEIAIKVIAII